MVDMEEYSRFTRIFAIFFLIFLGICESSQFKIRSSMKKIPVGGQVEIQFVLEGFNERNQIQAPQLDGFETLNQSTSTSIQIVNGQQSRSWTLSVVYRALQEGNFEIGPYAVEVNGRRIQSDSIQIQVSNDPVLSKGKGEVFLESFVEPSKGWSGQQMNYTLKIYRPASSSRYSRFSFVMPEFRDLIMEQEQALQSDSQVVVDGKLYLVTEVKVPFFAVKSGEIEIPAAGVNYVEQGSSGSRRQNLFDSFFNDDFFSAARGQKKTAWSSPIKLEILPLPEMVTGYSGLVGRFIYEAEVDKNQLKTGENMTLTLKVTGVGSLVDWKAPEFTIPGFRIYPDGEAQFEKRKTKEGELGGVRSFKYAIIPTVVGRHQIPAFELLFFNPVKGEYEKVLTKSIEIEVAAGEKENSSFVSSPALQVSENQKEKIKILQKDLLPVKTNELSANPFFSMAMIQGICLFFFLSPILFLGVESFQNYRKDPFEENYRQAYDLFLREKQVNGISGALISFLLRKMRQPVCVKTPQEIGEILKNSAMEKSFVTEISDFLYQEEFSRYSGSSGNSNESLVMELVKKINRAL